MITPFLQIILDASAYGFSWNHSDAYSCIGYICGYLRYYYPVEFITASLNIFADDLDKTSEIIKYAGKHGVIVTNPKWGISREMYSFDKETNRIAKGLSAVKYMSKKLANEMYDLSCRKKYTRFCDVLYDLYNETSIDARQLDILIKIDFFSDFGNQRELLRISEMFSDTFKKGEAKQIRKGLVDGTPLEPIVKKYAVGVTKSGGDAKSYTLLDIRSILEESEDVIKAVNMPDLPDILKVQNFYDVMGYFGYTSGKTEDRRKLYITEIYPVVRKKDGKQFGYSVVTRSIGSGVEGRFTVFNGTYNKTPVGKGDIIYCTAYERDGKYFRLTDYYKIN